MDGRLTDFALRQPLCPHISFKDDEKNDDDDAYAHSNDSMLMLMTIATAMLMSVMNL